MKIGVYAYKKPVNTGFKPKKNWQLPIFAYTIVGVSVLNYSVRDGKRCVH